MNPLESTNTNNGGDGGAVRFLAYYASGHGGRATNGRPGRAGPIVFALAQPAVADGPDEPDKEVVRFEADGRVYVRGELVDSNPDIWQALAEFIATARPHAEAGYHLEWKKGEKGKVFLVPVRDDPSP